MKKKLLFGVILLSSRLTFCSSTGPGSGGGGNYPVSTNPLGKGGAEAGGGPDFDNVRRRAHVSQHPSSHSLFLTSDNSRLPADLTNEILSFLTSDDEQSLAQTNVDHDIAYRQKHKFDLALQKCQCLILRGHQSWVLSVAVSADGRIVSGGSDDTIRIWNATTGRELQVLRGHKSWVHSVAVLANNKIVSGGGSLFSGTVRMWNASTGKQLQILRGYECWVRSVATSGDGTRIVFGGCDKAVRMWNATTGRELQVLRGHEGWVLSVAVSADGRIVSGGEDNTVRVWNATTGRELQILKGHEGSVLSVATSGDGTRIVSGGEDNTVRIWNATTGACENILRGHEGWVRSVAVLAGNRIVSGGDDRTVRIWNATTGEQLQVLRGHYDRVCSVAVLADGRILSGGHDKTIRIWRHIKYLEEKYEQSLSMTASKGRALFASDGKGVYEALFPQPRKRVAEVGAATYQVSQKQPISAAEAARRLQEEAGAEAVRDDGEVAENPANVGQNPAGCCVVQ